MATVVKNWLKSIGLEQYADAFQANDIEWETLPDLNHELLKEAGITSIGHRIALLKAINALDDDKANDHTEPNSTETKSVGQLANDGAERRQLTVMFCDLVGSTALSAAIDPEDYRELISNYQAATSQAVRAYGGFVAKYMGDGLLVYFGYPVAQENDAERAARAGLDVIDAVRSIKSDAELAVRVGVATGQVVVGDIIGEGASQEAAVLGETPNLAARLQEIAEPNTVLIGPATHRLIESVIETEALSKTEIKGLPQPVIPFRVVRARTQSEVEETRFETTPLIGRDAELKLLERAWNNALESEGQAILFSAEPGVGKSRLLKAFQDTVLQCDITRVLWYCSPYHQNTANYPAIEQLRWMLRLTDNEAEISLTRLETMLDRLGLSVERLAPTIASFISLPTGERYHDLEGSPEQIKREFTSVQRDLLLAASKRAPTLLVVEDLHWADPTTLEVLDEIIDAVRNARILVVLTARPEFHVPWTSRSNVTTHKLTHLNRHETRQLIDKIVEDAGLDGKVVDQIIERTDGVPLYVEELTKDVLEACENSGVPASLQDSLMARLDRLGTSKELAQAASIIGRSFSTKALSEITSQPLENLESSIKGLMSSGLVRRRADYAEEVYEFKHALVRDAAYDSILRATRRKLHGRYAEYLVKMRVADQRPELLAQHYSAGGLYQDAISRWEQASTHAMQQSAHAEAVEHLTQAIGLLDELPDRSSYLERELAMQVALGRALTLRKGYGAPEAGPVYERARNLCQHVNDVQRRAEVLRGLWAFHLLRAELDTAAELAEEILELSQSTNDTDLIAGAYHTTGTSLFFQGKFSEAYEHSELGFSTYQHRARHEQKVRYGDNPGVMCGIYTALDLWLLGYPDKALQRLKESERLVQEVDRAVDTTLWLTFAARLHAHRQEADLAGEYAARAIALSEEHGFPFFLAYANVLKGWALLASGLVDDGVDLMKNGLEARRATGTVVLQSYFSAQLAEFLASVGQTKLGQRLFVEAFENLKSTGERWCEAELYRIDGAIKSEQSEMDKGEAETSLLSAISVARAQKAKSWELRAATDLARLWQARGRTQEAHDLLAPVYGWFTEGFGTADLRSAMALLHDLD
jgi:class 3 adenylate cyclase/predicted ATPase